MVVDEDWIGVEAETASEGGVLCHSWQNTATTRIPRESQPRICLYCSDETITLALSNHATPWRGV